ncbi:MAG: hypothetical protein H6742_06545 [Alphaproteobacteria bacterium]|nr:hypothetical protein [Alphaproteobacteria bacterium]
MHAAFVLAQVSPPPFHFTPMTWAGFALANAIIIAIIAPKLIREIRNRG